MRIVHADHVLPGDAPPIGDGAVAVDPRGSILDVGPAAEVLPRHAGAPVERFRGVVFPGLVNAHTHVELSAMHRKIPGGTGFIEWVDRLVTTRSEVDAEEEHESIARGVAELERAATVAVGDITNSLGAVAELARRGIGGCVFHEVFGIDRAIALERIDRLSKDRDAKLPEWPTKDLAYAPAPHTLYTLHPDGARALLANGDVRTSLHLAEHAAERRAIEHGEGPVPEWFTARLRQGREWPKRALFDVAADLGALRPHVLLVHLTDARPDELARVARRGASVVLCPRSNLHIEGRLPPLLAVREAGLEPALGTDSLASNASLDVLDEARLLAERFPNLPRWELLKMATWNGARALGRPDLGRIARGSRPGVYGVTCTTNDPVSYLFDRADSPRTLLVSRFAVSLAAQSKEPS